MTFAWDPTDGAVLYGPDGDVVWSSSRQQAYWTDELSGSFTIPAMPGVNSVGIISPVTTNIKAVASNATHLMGSFTATQSGGYTLGGTANGGIHQLGGSTILMMATYQMYPSNIDVSDVQYKTWVTGARTNVSGAIILTTFVEGGFFKATVERYKPTADAPASWSGLGTGTITIAYQGVAFTFDN